MKPCIYMEIHVHSTLVKEIRKTCTCCLFDLACFFLPSFSSLIKMYTHMHTHTCTCTCTQYLQRHRHNVCNTLSVNDGVIVCVHCIHVVKIETRNWNVSWALAEKTKQLPMKSDAIVLQNKVILQHTARDVYMCICFAFFFHVKISCIYTVHVSSDFFHVKSCCI